MAYFPNAFQKLLVGTAGFSIKNGQPTYDLVAGEVGIIDAKTNKILDITPAVPVTYAVVPQFYLAQGSLHTVDKLGPFHGGYQETVKSKGINPKYVSRFYRVDPANSVQNVIVIGAANPTVFDFNKTYRFRIDIKGSPALRTMRRNLYKDLDAFTGCVPAVTDPVTVVDAATIVEQWATQINEDLIIGNFVKAEVLYTTIAAEVPTTVTVKPAGWDAVLAADKYARLQLTGAYVDSTFANCSWSRTDNFDFTPLSLYASAYEAEGETCYEVQFPVIETQEAFQGRNYGEPLLKELILSNRYRQEDFPDDTRMREILNDNSMNAISRTAKYVTYHILHSIPRKSNPSGTLDADQYLIKIVVNALDATFEAWMNTLLTSANNAVQLEILK
jgi:hypothetical protein